MGDIKFHGKRLDNGEWVYGFYWIEETRNHNKHHIYTFEKKGSTDLIRITGNYNVDPATVGQYTGLKDSDGAEIYDGAIIAFDFVGFDGDFYNERRIGLVRYSNEFCAFVISDNLVDDFFGNDLIYFGDAFRASGEVEGLGNRWDNPELLGEAGA